VKHLRELRNLGLPSEEDIDQGIEVIGSRVFDRRGWVPAGVASQLDIMSELAGAESSSPSQVPHFGRWVNKEQGGRDVG
jgi:hypothetical protein